MEAERTYDRLRREMVRSQIEARGIRDKRVLEAMRRVPRHRFVPEKSAPEAYCDHPVPIGESQTISQPYIVALMTECLRLEGDESVLEIGTGSGYQAAVLAELAKKVYTVERVESLGRRAESLLSELGYSNISFRLGDGSGGWELNAPYEGIIVTAGAPEVPGALVEQLKEGGRLVIPVGSGCSQDLTVVEKRGGRAGGRRVSGCVFVPLIGRHGHRE